MNIETIITNDNNEKTLTIITNNNNKRKANICSLLCK